MMAASSATQFGGTIREVAAAWRGHWAALTPGWVRACFRSRTSELVIDCDSLADAVIPRGASRDVIIRLSPEQVLCRTLHMPNASARVLGKAILLELERLSPLNPASIVHDIHVVKRDRSLRQATLELRMVRGDLLESIAAQCRSLGFHIAGLQLPQPSSVRRWTAYPVNPIATVRLRANRWVTAGLGGLALLLMGCTVTAEYLRGAAVQRRIIAELEAERIRANAISPIRNRIEADRNEILHFIRERNSTLFVVYLTEISAILPDSAWATRVEISPENIRIQGFARAASELIPLFEKSPRFTNARFRQPVTRTAGSGPESFDLTLDIAVPL